MEVIFELQTELSDRNALEILPWMSHCYCCKEFTGHSYYRYIYSLNSITFYFNTWRQCGARSLSRVPTNSHGGKLNPDFLIEVTRLWCLFQLDHSPETIYRLQYRDCCPYNIKILKFKQFYQCISTYVHILENVHKLLNKRKPLNLDRGTSGKADKSQLTDHFSFTLWFTKTKHVILPVHAIDDVIAFHVIIHHVSIVSASVVSHVACLC